MLVPLLQGMMTLDQSLLLGTMYVVLLTGRSSTTPVWLQLIHAQRNQCRQNPWQQAGVLDIRSNLVRFDSYYSSTQVFAWPNKW